MIACPSTALLTYFDSLFSVGAVSPALTAMTKQSTWVAFTFVPSVTAPPIYVANSPFLASKDDLTIPTPVLTVTFSACSWELLAGCLLPPHDANTPLNAKAEITNNLDFFIFFGPP